MIKRGFFFPLSSVALVFVLQACSGGGDGSGSLLDQDTVTRVSFSPSMPSAVDCAVSSPASHGPVNTLNCADPGVVSISGQVTFDRVPHVIGDSGLNYAGTTQDPVRGATIQAIYPGGVQSTASDASGNYTLCVPENTSNMVIRARAEMLRTDGAPSWNFTVVDNTSAQAVYTMQTSAFNVVTSDITGKDLHADSGWGGSSYTSTRVAAPFAILDSTYDAFQKVLAACPGAQFPALKLNWSVNNVPASGDRTLGQITTSLFDGREIYILGAEDNDTDEYDGHVIIHEWGHYFEEYFSRADSIGGIHTGGDILDVRVAFGEGWGNAYSAMATDDPDYNDAQGTLQAAGFDINIESNACGINRGWYSECSVQSVLFDLYDAANDDMVNLAFSPLFDVLANEQRNTLAVTSIFSFVHELKQNNSAVAGNIDSLLGNQNIDAVTDIFGDSQLTNDPGTTAKLPLHETIAPGETVNVCSTSEHQEYNGLGVHRFLRFDASAGDNYRIRAVRTSGVDPADPDIELYFRGQSTIADSIDNNSETMEVSLSQTGTYVIAVYDFENFFSSGATTCFDVSLTSI